MNKKQNGVQNQFAILRGMKNDGDDMDSAGILASKTIAPALPPKASRRSTTLLSTHKATYSSSPSPKFAKPKEIGYFSCEKGVVLTIDRSCIKELSFNLDPSEVVFSGTVGDDLLNLCEPQKEPVNLAKDFDPKIPFDKPLTAYSKQLLKWLLQCRAGELPENRSLADCCGGAEFVGNVKLLATIASTLYNLNQPWELNVVRSHDLFFLVSTTKESLPAKNPEEDDLNRYCGGIFEQMATDSAGFKTLPFFSVVRSSIKSAKRSHQLLIAGKIDCENDNQEYVEIAVRRVVETEKDLRSMSFKVVAVTPYNAKEWVINVLRYQNVFFLVRVEKARVDKKEGLFVTNKFVNLVTCDVGSESDTWINPGDAMDSSTRFSAIFRAYIRSASSSVGHRLLYVGGMDCVDRDRQYVAVKVSKAIADGDRTRLWQFYRHKMLKEYLRCNLMGVDRLVIGFQDPDDKLVKIGEFEVDKIPEQAESILEDQAWTPSVCMNFLEAFLSDLKAKILENDINAIYQIKFTPFQPGKWARNSGLQFKRLDDANIGESGFEYLQSISEQFT